MSDTPHDQGEANGDNLQSIVWRLPGVFAARRRVFILTFACVLIGALVGTYVKRQYFESTARLLVKLEQRDVLLSQAEVRHEQVQRALDEAVATQAELMRSGESIGNVVDQLGADIIEGPKPTSWVGRTISSIVKGATGALKDGLAALGLVTKLSPRDAAVEEIQKRLTIYPVRRAQLIEVTFQARRPDAAPKVLEVLLNLHLTKLAQLNALSERYEFYRKQSEQMAQGLHESEAGLARFKALHAVIEFQAEKGMLIQKIERLTALLEGVSPGTSVELSTVAASGESGAGRPEMRGLPVPQADGAPQLGGNELSQLMVSLNQFRLERARRITLFNHDDPRVQELDNQIAVAEGIVSKQVAQIRKLIVVSRARLALLDRIEPELRQKQRDVATREENYRTYLRATEDRRISLDEQSRVILQVVEAPSAPVKPVSSRLWLLLFGVGAALAAAVAAVLLVEFGSVRTSAAAAGAGQTAT